MSLILLNLHFSQIELRGPLYIAWTSFSLMHKQVKEKPNALPKVIQLISGTIK